MENLSDIIGKGIAAVGVALVAIALMALFTIWQTVNQIMVDPTQVPVVKFFVDKIGNSDQGIFGTAGEQKFDVHLGEPLRYMLYVIMGTMALGILVRVFSGLIHAGAGMIKLGASMPAVKPDTSNRPPL
jgi:hypothetical protein